jgi:hypothetical protein
MMKQDILNIISAQLDTMSDFSQLQIFVKKHLGQYSNVDVMNNTTQKFTDNEPNVTAATQIYKMIKLASLSAQQTSRPTSLGFNLSIDKNGNANQMQVQDFKKH